MSTKPKRWHERVADMPRLTAEQIEAVKDIVSYHLQSLIFDHPRVDDAAYGIQQDIDDLKAKP